MCWNAAPVRYVLLRNAAVSTSGDAFQHIVIDGVRYSHIVDPRTGMALTTPIGVTVIAPRGARSDPDTKPIAVLGAEKGISILSSLPHTAAIVVKLDDSGSMKVHESAGIKDLKFVPSP